MLPGIVRAVVTVLSLSLLAGLLHAQPAPLADYVQYPDFSSAKLAPDGKHIAMVVPHYDHDELLIVDSATLQVTAGTATLVGRFLAQFAWANEERIVYNISWRFPDTDPLYLSGDLHAMNVNGSREGVLAGPATEEQAIYSLLDPLSGDRDHVRVLRRPTLDLEPRPDAYLLNVNTIFMLAGRDTRIDRVPITHRLVGPLPSGTMMTDNNGEVRLGYTVNDQGHRKVMLLEGEQWVDVSTALGMELASPDTEVGAPIRFNADNNGIYHFVRSPHGTIGVALYDIASKASTLLFSHEKYDAGTSDLIWSADGATLLGVAVMAATPESHYFSDHPDVRFYRSLERSLPGYRIQFLNFTDDQRKGLAVVSGPTMPPGLFLLDRDTAEFSPLFSSRPELQETPMTEPELLSVLARDGTQLDAYLTPAAGIEGAAPLIVLVHGGPHDARDGPVFDPEVKLLSARGYSVLQVNYRGSAGYGPDFQRAGFRNWGTTMVDDIVDASRYVAEQGKAPSDRICIMGASVGGYAAMMALARYPDVYKCGIGVDGVYDLELARSMDVTRYVDGAAYLDRVIGSADDALRADSPITHADTIKAPVFLAQGGEDRRLLPTNGPSFRRALEDADVKVEWLRIQTPWNGFEQPEHREELYTKLFEFLAENL